MTTPGCSPGWCSLPGEGFIHPRQVRRVENIIMEAQQSERKSSRPALLISLFIASLAFGGLAIWIANHSSERWLWAMRKNLILAWLPLLLATGFDRLLDRAGKARWLALPCALLWFLYYPNAPYLCTEFLHLSVTLDKEYWMTMVMIEGSALIGLILGFLSLEIIQIGRASCRERV